MRLEGLSQRSALVSKPNLRNVHLLDIGQSFIDFGLWASGHDFRAGEGGGSRQVWPRGQDLGNQGGVGETLEPQRSV